MLKLTSFTLATALSVVFPIYALSHGGGLTVQTISEEYVVTLDAVSAEVYSGFTERINFEIESSGETASSIQFTHIWVRIIDPEGRFLFGGNIDASPKGFVTGISIFFPVEGIYSITTRFYNDENLIVETDSLLLVGGEAKWVLTDKITTLILVVACLVLGYTLRYVQNKKNLK